MPDKKPPVVTICLSSRLDEKGDYKSYVADAAADIAKLREGLRQAALRSGQPMPEIEIHVLLRPHRIFPPRSSAFHLSQIESKLSTPRFSL